MDRLPKIIKSTQELLRNDLETELSVQNLVELAITSDLDEGISIPENEQWTLRLGSLLYNVDNPKYFKTIDYANARSILKSVKFKSEIIELTINKIKISQGLSKSINRWDNYLRASIDLQKIGINGIRKCKEYSIKINQPLFLPQTLRATNRDELYQIITYDRHQNYINNKQKSASMIDYFYNQLMHIRYYGQNKYLIDEYLRRYQIMELFLIEFGKTGEIPDL